MPSTVSLHFISSQFAFNSGQILFFKGARLSSDGEMSPGDLRDGSVDGVLVEGPIEFDAMLYQLNVTRTADKRPFDISYLWVTHAMTGQEIGSGRVVVELDLAVVLVIRVEDSAGSPVPGAIVNFLLPSREGSTEGPVNDQGEVFLFGTPGHYSFQLVSVGDRPLGRERVRARFEVKADDRGERVIVLRVSTNPSIPSP